MRYKNKTFFRRYDFFPSLLLKIVPSAKIEHHSSSVALNITWDPLRLNWSSLFIQRQCKKLALKVNCTDDLETKPRFGDINQFYGRVSIFLLIRNIKLSMLVSFSYILPSFMSNKGEIAQLVIFLMERRFHANNNIESFRRQPIWSLFVNVLFVDISDFCSIVYFS